MDALHKAFERYPPLRMRLLEELAREVSRAYYACSLSQRTRSRRPSTPVPAA
jgi:CRP-like cAMP-binding protein